MEPQLIAGVRAVAAALEAQAEAPLERVLLARRGSRALDELESRAREQGVPVERVSPAALDRRAHGLRHQGVLALAPPYPYVALEELLGSAPEAPLLMALDSITDPHNLGAIVRSAVAFGVHGLILPKRRAVGVTPTVTRVSTGATANARIAQVTNLARALSQLADAGYEVVGLAGEGEVSIGDLGPAPGGRVLVVGSEGKGLGRLIRERCDRLARIELPGPVESLNASVAAAVAIYACSERALGDT